MSGITKLLGFFGGLSPKWRGIFIVTAIIVSAWAGMSIQERSSHYHMGKVSIGSVVSTITSVGTLKPFEEVEIHSAISGTVTEVLKQQSDGVSSGDVLIRLDTAVLKSRYDKARAELDTKESDFNYQAELYDKQLTSTNDYNRAKIAMEQAKAEFSEADNRLKAAEIKSPIDGTVVLREVEVGRSVDSRDGMLMKVAGDPAMMRLFIRVSEADIGRISEGQKVHFTVPAFRNKVFTGEVVSLPGAPLEGTGAVTYEVSALVENPQHSLKSGMTADVTVKTAQVDNVLRIPTAALRFLPSDGSSAHASESAAVWIRKSTGELQSVPVEIGESNELYAEVKAGDISEGDSVVVGVVSGGGREDSTGMSLPQPKRF